MRSTSYRAATYGDPILKKPKMMEKRERKKEGRKEGRYLSKNAIICD
jgi:hypothetical protein